MEGPSNAFLLEAELRVLVSATVFRDIEHRADDTAAATTRATVGFLALLSLLLFGVVALSTSVGRSISRPLRQLSRATRQVAEATERELMRVSDEDRPDEPLPAFTGIELDSPDEIGELAAALNRVQNRAVQLLQRQIVSRRNIAAMFGSIGRRTQNLTGRQLAMIDDLERDETDPKLLESLYRLDHLTNRLRRNANSLVVLSGATEPVDFGDPLPVSHLVRSALAEIEDFQRVRFSSVTDVRISPDVSSALKAMVAELVENAVSFSSPSTVVDVTAARVADGCLITVTDSGVGMSEERLAEENARLVRGERLDLAPSDVLGLFVVGRLSRRTGILVRLGAGDGGGVTAWINVPHRHLVRAGGPQPVPVAARQPLAALTPAEPPPPPSAPALAAGPAGPAGPTWQAGPSAPRVPGGPAAAPPSGPYEGNGEPWRPGPVAPPPGPHRAETHGDRPPAPGLSRRVAGTHMTAAWEPPQEEPAWGPPREDPQESRSLVEQFESGASRAMRDRDASRLSGSAPAAPAQSPSASYAPGAAPAHPVPHAPAAHRQPPGGAPVQGVPPQSPDTFHGFVRNLQTEIRTLAERQSWSVPPAAGPAAAAPPGRTGPPRPSPAAEPGRRRASGAGCRVPASPPTWGARSSRSAPSSGTRTPSARPSRTSKQVPPAPSRKPSARITPTRRHVRELSPERRGQQLQLAPAAVRHADHRGHRRDRRLLGRTAHRDVPQRRPRVLRPSRRHRLRDHQPRRRRLQRAGAGPDEQGDHRHGGGVPPGVGDRCRMRARDRHGQEHQPGDHRL